MIRVCTTSDLPAIHEIINESAQAYKGVIPADVWHEPYMPMAYLQSEIEKGVRFYEKNGVTLLPPAEARRLFGIYWTIPERQITASVVLANARWFTRTN